MLERFSIRWRLALISAALTFLVLLGFSVVVGQLTTSKIRSDFNSETANAASELGNRLALGATPSTVEDIAKSLEPDLDLYSAANGAEVRAFYNDPGRTLLRTTKDSPDFGRPVQQGSSEVGGYLVETRLAYPTLVGYAEQLNAVRFPVWIEYARPLAEVKATIRRVRVFLGVGVIGGTLLALLGGLALARRSLRPITGLTATARDIARTGDPDRQVPQPRADDEVAELARTFSEMLGALEGSRRQTEDALERQRAFVADASHELRTPLTSVLANLELLTDDLEGEPREAAEAALRSSRRMRRLVADLLLLARSDTGHEQAMLPVNLSQVALDAVAEAGALSPGHELTVDAEGPVVVTGARDDLHRMVLNLVENAIRHTPAGCHVRVITGTQEDTAMIAVEDDGPGVPPELRTMIFERFVRSEGDRGGSTGLGLAIVQAVARAHGGEVTLEDAEPGARFVVRLPLLCESAELAPVAEGLSPAAASRAAALRAGFTRRIRRPGARA